MYMFINKKIPINQFGQFEKPRILVMIYGIKLNNLGECLKGKGNDGSHESVTYS
jgi:hypothetical protein